MSKRSEEMMVRDMLERVQKVKAEMHAVPWTLGMPKRDVNPLRAGGERGRRRRVGGSAENPVDLTEDGAGAGNAGGASNPIVVNDENEASVGDASGEQALCVDWHRRKQSNCVDAVLGHLRKDANIVLSPYSLMCCMAMMCRGASRGNGNAAAFEEVAYYCWPTEDAGGGRDGASHAELAKYVTQLQPVRACQSANMIIARGLKEDYVADIQEHFAATRKEPGEWKQVNEMVRRVTTMQADILQGEPDGSVLVNAVFFEDRWLLPFGDKLAGMRFKTSSNTVVNVQTMTVKGTFRVAKHGHLTAVHMLYETPGMGAWFVKNSEPTKGHEDALSYDNLRSFIQQEFVSQSLTSSKATLVVKVPKITLQYSMDLRNVFQSVEEHKITKVFQAGNLDRMTANRGEYFSVFKQNCLLKVDPKGTTAAAVTYAGSTRGRGSTPKKVTFAHTFYMVIHYPLVYQYSRRRESTGNYKSYLLVCFPNSTLWLKCYSVGRACGLFRHTSKPCLVVFCLQPI
jgi:serine protease inhibitor